MNQSKLNVIAEWLKNESSNIPAEVAEMLNKSIKAEQQQLDVTKKCKEINKRNETNNMPTDLQGLTLKGLNEYYLNLTGSELNARTKQLAIDAIKSILRARVTGEAFARLV